MNFRFLCTLFMVHFSVIVFSTESPAVEDGDTEGEDTDYVEQWEALLPRPTDNTTRHNLKLCKGATISPGVVELPALYVGDDGATVHYVSLSYKLSETNALHKCPYEEKTYPELNVTISLSVEDYYLKLNHTPQQYEVQLKHVLMWENGYLSVGNQSELQSIVYYSPHEYCFQENKGIEFTFKICESPKERVTLPKCCPPGQIVHSTDGCIIHANYSTWEPEYFDETTRQLVPYSKVNPILESPLLNCENNDVEFWMDDGCDEHHPSTEGRLAFIGPHRNWIYLTPDSKYCLDIVYDESDEGHTSIQSTAIICAVTKENSEDGGKEPGVGVSYLYMVCMYIGAFFHFLTTIVYGLTWSKQNIHGKTLFSCTLSLFAMKLMMGNTHLMVLLGMVELAWPCIANAIGAQYFMIACFTWLLIVNTDMWLKFRSILRSRTGALKRYIGYSCLGWGFPLVITGISVIINFTFTCRSSRVIVPEYGKRNCFLAPWAQTYYMYYMLCVFLTFTVILGLLTVKAIYSVKRSSSGIRRSKGDNISLLFFKLSVIVGLSVSWAIEVICSFAIKDGDGYDWWWDVLDVYGALSGLLIFVIFVCKRNTLSKLEPVFEGIIGGVAKIIHPGQTG